MISTEQEAINHLDVEILRVQSMLNDLISKRGTIESRVAMLKVLISPVKELPNEIISRIFEQYAHGPCPDPTYAINRQPWYLGHICSRWRTVALATPNLWNYFVIDIDEYAEGNRRSLEIAQHLLARTKKAPVSCLVSRREASMASIQCAFEILSDHTKRLHYLEIDGIDGISSLTELSEVPFSVLGAVKLACYPLGEASTNRVSPQSPITLFNDTPLLRRIRLSTSPGWVDPDLMCFRLPWNQLTHLHIAKFELITFHAIHAVLTECPNLRECTLDLPDDRKMESVPLPVIELRYLESFGFTNHAQGRYGAFLQHLVTPALKRLSLISPRYLIRWSFHHIFDLIMQSVCKIEALKVHASLSGGFLVALLDETPTLKRLSIEVEDLSTILERMARDCFLPDLRLIEYLSGAPRLQVQRLQATLGESLSFKSTPNHHAPVKLVLVYEDPLRSNNWTTGLRELQEKGLEVHVNESTDKDFLNYLEDVDTGEMPTSSVLSIGHCDASAQYW